MILQIVQATQKYSYQQKTTGQYLEWTAGQAVYIGQQDKWFTIVNCFNLLKLHKKQHKPSLLADCSIL